MKTAAPGQPVWLRSAWSELGQREIAGPASNPRIAEYIRQVGHPALADDATPWCAAFVGACLERAGIDGTGSLRARSYLDWGEPLAPDLPALGAIAVLSRGANPAHGHVGFLVGRTDDALFLLGGNQSDAVTVTRFDAARLLGLRWPAATGASASQAARPAVPDFDWSLVRILEFEGGWTDDPFDPGGPTNRGITLAVYARALGESVTAASIARLKAGLREISDDLVARIYLERYWKPANCPDLPAPLAHFHFDAAVNQGVTGAARMLQAALGVDVDGEIGPVTLAAVRAAPMATTLDRYADRRRRQYRSLDHFWRFGRGWLARVDKALAQSRQLIDGANERPAPSHAPRQPDRERNHMPDTATPEFPTEGVGPQPGKWWGESLTIWGVLLTALTTVAPSILSALGLDVPVELLERLGHDTVSVVQAIGGLAGTVIAILGRVRATAPLARRAMAVRV